MAKHIISPAESLENYPLNPVERPVHSTAAEGAVTRTNKFGDSMPILKPHPLGGFHVDHGGNRLGQIWQYDNKWWSSKSVGESGVAHPHSTKHEAVMRLFESEPRGTMEE